jgi:hypothetical protein
MTGGAAPFFACHSEATTMYSTPTSRARPLRISYISASGSSGVMVPSNRIEPLM